MRNKWLKLLLLLPLLFGQTFTQAQATVDSSSTFYIVSGFVLVVAILVLIVSVVVLQVLRVFVKQEMERKGIVEEKKETKPWYQKWLTKANDAVPLEREQEIILDHNYDGIKELDNHLPPWWQALFWVTVIFGVVYMLGYHVFETMPLQLEEYRTEIEQAEEARQARLANQPAAEVDESNLAMVEDVAALKQGAQVFNLNCAACHKEDGGGGIGPNLTDEYWIHGGSLTDVYMTVKNGVPEKGMIAWKDMLSPEQMLNVSSYVMTLKGTTPANPKDPQGEVYRPDAEEGEVIGEDPADAEVESDTTQIAVND